MRLVEGLRPDPLGELQRSPRPDGLDRLRGRRGRGVRNGKGRKGQGVQRHPGAKIRKLGTKFKFS